MPVLAVLGMQPEVMGWGTRPEDVRAVPAATGTLRPDRGRRPLRAHRAARDRRRAGPRVPVMTNADSEGPACRSPSAPSFRTLRHGRIGLALHQLRPGAGRPLLLLHGLGEQSPTEVPAASAAWPGPVCALDFTGHGCSDAPRGGGYTAEILMGDVDAALGAPRRGDDRRSRGRRVRRAARRRRPAHPGPGRGAGRRSRSGRGRSQPRVAVARAPARGRRRVRPIPSRSSSWPATSGRRTTRSPMCASRCSSRGSTTRSRSRRPFGPPWLEAVAGEMGVLEEPVATALGRYAVV